MTVSSKPSNELSCLHDPVMRDEMLSALAPHGNEIYIDGTFGAGGYTCAILERAPQSTILAFDRDPEARTRYDDLPASFRDHILFFDTPFSRMKDVALAHGFSSVHGIVLDLGVSSPQIDQAARGFSFRFDGPLDMRMDPRSGESAADVVNGYDEKTLADILYTYGEERESRRVARAIVKARTLSPIRTTAQLADIVRGVIHKSPKETSDPCTRTFQALRIFVNSELDELSAALEAATALLAEGGRLVIVTFHSLEDRIVKQFFNEQSGRTPHPSRHAPQSAPKTPLFTLPFTRAISSSESETRRNPRARSAHLRVAIRTRFPLCSEVS